MSTEMPIEQSEEDRLTRDLPLVYNRFARMRDNIYTSARGVATAAKVLKHDERIWMSIEDPRDLIVRVTSDMNERLCRLLAVAFCRLVWTRLDKRHREVVQAVENIADGAIAAVGVSTFLEAYRRSLTHHLNSPRLIYSGESSVLWAEQYYASRELTNGSVATFERHMATTDMKVWRRMYSDRAVYWAVDQGPRVSMGQAMRHVLATGLSKTMASRSLNVLSKSSAKIDARVAAKLCNLVRDVLGNPYREYPPIKPDLLLWHDGAIPQMAKHIYDTHDFWQMPILADMLQDADAEPLFVEHARHGGLHCRGCWLLDAILNKREEA